MARGRIVFTKTGMPRLKQYLDEMKGVPLQDVWDDIPPVNSQAVEALGYPTQKPLVLLERIIKASSNENDIVLDAFCGCGTAILAAQNLKRQWIGIDISPTSCSVMAKRLRDNTTLREDEDLWKVGRGFVVQNLPFTVELLRKMPPFEFENWAVKQLNGRANKVQIGDKGIDGRIYPVGVTPRETGAGELALEESWYPIQVKQKDKTSRPLTRSRPPCAAPPARKAFSCRSITAKKPSGKSRASGKKNSAPSSCSPSRNCSTEILRTSWCDYGRFFRQL
jgi:hypothetical protein